MSDVAICFILARPREERPLECFDRRVRGILSRIPVVWRAIPPRWSPLRRIGYGAGLRACVQSLRRHTRKPPLVLLLKPDPRLTLADVDQMISFNTTSYQKIPFIRSYYGPEVYYKLEIFKLRHLERIVYLDCDTIVLDDISPLWDLKKYSDKALYAVRETKDMGVHRDVVGKFNTGVMVINPRRLRPDAYGRMLELALASKSYDGGDQGVINRYFEEIGEEPGELEIDYNVLVIIKKFGQWDTVKNRIKILHYANIIKPWAPGHDLDVFFDPELKRVWDEAYEVRGNSYGA